MRKRSVIVIIVIILLTAVSLFLYSPYFNINKITVEGLESVMEEEILTRAGVNGKTNLFFFNENKARAGIMENLYIDSAVFKKDYPKSLHITVGERHLTGYIEYLSGRYLYTDENGRVIEINSFIKDDLPVIVGLKFDKVRLGEMLEVENADAFKTVVRYSRLLEKYKINDRVFKIDVSDTDNTRIFLYRIEFNVGGDLDADYKIRTILEMIENLPNADLIQGYVDMRTTKKQYFLKVFV
jgi:hypothetical protein